MEGKKEEKKAENIDMMTSDEEEIFSDEDEDFSEQDFEDILLDSTTLKEAVNEINKKIEMGSKKKQTTNNFIKILVSKQKRRFTLDDITERIIAMGFPAEKLESIYRNDMADVVKCSEKKYKVSNFNNMVVEKFYFDDHNPPRFRLIFEFCEHLDNWLKKDPLNVAGIHCKAGKGRTGVMICCFLLFYKIFTKAYDALKYYGMIRTKNKKVIFFHIRKGVTIPSQIRYVNYYETALVNNWNLANFKEPVLNITKIKFFPIPNLNMFGGCEPWFVITNQDYRFVSKSQIKLQNYKSEAFIEFNLSDVKVQGDFLLMFYNNSLTSSKEKVFQAWMNTAFVDKSGVCVIGKFMLDKACKDKNHKKFAKEFQLEIHTSKEIQYKISPNKFAEKANFDF